MLLQWPVYIISDSIGDSYIEDILHSLVPRPSPFYFSEQYFEKQKRKGLHGNEATVCIGDSEVCLKSATNKTESFIHSRKLSFIPKLDHIDGVVINNVTS